VIATGSHVGIAFSLTEYLDIASPVSNGIASILATLLSYVINAMWSFSSRLAGRTFFRFVTVASFGFLLAILIAWLAGLAGYSHLTGTLAVAFILPPVTFVLHNYWTFR
jgi:putative flippase GtrA